MPILSGSVAGVVMFGGVTVCLIAVSALRLVMLQWRGRVASAGGHRVAHLVWRRFDTFNVALWCTTYVLGGLAIVAGLIALDR